MPLLMLIIIMLFNDATIGVADATVVVADATVVVADTTIDVAEPQLLLTPLLLLPTLFLGHIS